MQEQGYRFALRTLLLRGASRRDMDNLRREYGISTENHERILDELTGKGGGHRQTVEDLLARMEDLRAVYRTLCGFVIGPALQFLELVLFKRQDRHVDHVLDVLSLMGMGETIRQQRPHLFAQDKVLRTSAIAALQATGEPELMERFTQILEERVPSYDPRELISQEQQEGVLDALASEHDPFVRAGAMLCSALPGETPRPSSIERLLSGMNDEDALVREAAIQALPTGWGTAAGNLPSDTDRNLRDAAQTAVSRRVGPLSGAGAMPGSGAPFPESSLLGPAMLPTGLPPPIMSPPTGPQPLITPPSRGPQPPVLLPKSGPQPPNLSAGPLPAVLPPLAAAPSVDVSTTSRPEKLDIGEGFGSAQADTMVTGRFAVPRVPTNLGPVCTNLERILFLHCVPLFVDFEPEDLLVLARASEERGYAEDSVLFHQGDIGDVVFVIISGRVQTLYADSGGHRRDDNLGPGDCIGEMSVIDGSLRSTTALVTGVNTRVLAIAGDTFRRFVEERAHVSGKIIGVLASRLREVVAPGARPAPSAATVQPSQLSA